jgi:hypothetical protein
VTSSAQVFFNEIRKRYLEYQDAIELESQSCARPGFAQKLWSAEEAHMLPRLEKSSQVFFQSLGLP